MPCGRCSSPHPCRCLGATRSASSQRFLFSSPVFRPADEAQHRETRELLRLFYSDRRVGHVHIEDSLLDCLRDDQWREIVLWGDCGIGKTWFLNHAWRIRVPQERGALRARIKGGLDRCRAQPVGRSSLCPCTTNLASIWTALLRNWGTTWRAALDDKIIAEISDRYPSLAKRQDGFREKADRLYAYWLQVAHLPVFNAVRLEWCNSKRVRLLFVVDNLDQLSDADLNALYDAAHGLLLYENVRVIYSIRSNTLFTRNPFSSLHLEPNRELQMPQLDMAAFLQQRFRHSKEGVDLATQPFTDPVTGEDVTFPELWERISRSQVFTELLCQLAGSDARLMIRLVDRLLQSPHLKQLRNVASLPHALTALMLSESGEFVPTHSVIPNLLDDSQPNLPGNCLIRARVLEYLDQRAVINYRERPTSTSFVRLGYDKARVRTVLQGFLEHKLIATEEGHQVESVDAGGAFKITNFGSYLWNALLRSQAYLDCIRRGMYVERQHVGQIHTAKGLISTITPKALVAYLVAEEDEENRRAMAFDRREHIAEHDFTPTQLSSIVRGAMGV